MYVKFIPKNPFCLILVTMTEKLKMTVAIYPMCYQRLGLDRDTTMYRLHTVIRNSVFSEK